MSFAASTTFWDSASDLPKSQRKRVFEVLGRYFANPASPGLHFEPLSGTADPKVRSLRLDQAYRIILVQPPKGDQMLAVWVAKHQEAYRWVQNKRFEVHPHQGVVQIYSVEEAEAALQETERRRGPVAPDVKRRFADFSDTLLLDAGVPAPLLASVRAVITDAEFEDLAPHLPTDAAQMLYHLAAGFSFEEAMDAVFGSTQRPATVDVEDFATALQHPASQAVFHLVEGEEELARMLDAPMDKWRVFLHPSQRRIVTMKAKGPVQVLGGAGTGKTVVLMHRARHIAEQVFTGPTDRILVTTYTRNLAADLNDKLAQLCTTGIERLDVQNLHAWALGYLSQKRGQQLTVVTEDERRAWMDEARAASIYKSHSLAFFLDEWHQVIQAQELATEEDYLRAARVGRGTRLDRAQRIEVWKVLDRFRALLRERGRMDWQDVVREARQAITTPPFRAVLADEVQDFTPSELRLLRALAPRADNDLFVVGDAHQRIYGSVTALSRCGIEVKGRSRRLRINYRTTEQICAHGVAILKGVPIDDLDGGTDNLQGYRSLRTGPKPRTVFASSEREELDTLLATLRTWLESTAPEDICVAARTNDLAAHYERALQTAGLPTVRLTREAPPTGPGIRIATMHRLKGLEFRRIALCGLTDANTPPPAPAGAADPVAAEEQLQRERCLHYVAVTRARDELVVLSRGTTGAPRR